MLELLDSASLDSVQTVQHFFDKLLSLTGHSDKSTMVDRFLAGDIELNFDNLRVPRTNSTAPHTFRFSPK